MRISKKMFYLLFAVVLLVGLVPLTAAAQPAAQIEQALLDQLAGGPANFFVKMSVEADLSAAAGMDWTARGQYVWNALNEVANATQGPVLDYCAKNGLTCTPMLINNSVFVRAGTLDAAQGLAALPGVSFLRLERVYTLDPVLGGAGINGFQTTGANPDATTDWGITDTKADQFWTAFGVKGDNIKVANIDTGVQWNHPALQDSFACAAGNDANCWADPSNICGGTACDNNGHGTHTMGTMVANDDANLPYIAGMAPNASWIACKGCESSSCSEFALTTCATWIVAPNGNPDLRPDVVNNSWGGGGGDTWYLSYVQSWVAAGIFPAFSAGNNYSCSAMGSPGDYQESFASASHMSSRNISDFSSKGPSPFGHAPYTKPNISAPGSSICSTVPTNSWSCGYSGTSMASPHSAGAVALLWSCNPSLVGQIDLTFQALQNSADTPPAGTCGAPPDGEGNYTFGYGYLNVLNAGIAYCGGVETGYLEGYVKDQNGNPVAGATVSAQQGAEGAGINATTDPNGYYWMELVVGTYNVTASKTNYTSQTQTGVDVVAGMTTTLPDFVLTYLGGWTQITLPAGCPDWTRLDAEYSEATGLVYLMGGRPGTDTDGSIYSFNGTSCADTGLDMPVPISNYTIVRLTGAGGAEWLCTFGGRDNAGGYTTAVQCFDPVANTVAQVSTLPGELGAFIPGGANAVGNIAYVFSGFRNTASPYHTTQTWAWDPVANTWAQKGNISLGRGYIDNAVYDGKIYAFGGDTFDGASLIAQTIAEVFDPATGTWNDAAVADLPVASGEGRAFAFEADSGYALAGKIIDAGGGQWSSASNEVVAYDVASDTYDYDFPNLGGIRRDHAGVFVPGNPGTMWVIGGWYGADAQPFGPPEYYEVPMGGATEPDIAVDPTELFAEQCADTVTQQTLQICNEGTADLTWTLTEEAAKLGTYVPGKGGTAVLPGASSATTGVPKAMPAAPNPDDVLWDQYGTASGSVFAAQDFESTYDAYDIYGGDDFVNAEPWQIDKIVTLGGGWNGYTSLLNATAVHWYIYADNGGKPAGFPGDGAEFWSLSLPPDDPAVGYGVYEPEDLILTLDTPINLPAGNWWLVYFASMEFGLYGQCGWAGTSDAVTGYPGEQGNPGGGFGGGTDWHVNSQSQDYMFRLEGTIGGVEPGVPWLDENPTSGTVVPGDCADVTVTFDSTGLAAGDYFANLVIDSNDPDEPQVVVPVQLTVTECGNELTCGWIGGWGRVDPYGRLVIKWKVGVVDQDTNPVGEVAVTADLTWPTGGPVSRTRMSNNTNGIANFPWGSNVSGTWTIDVSDMVKAGYTFVDGAQCHAEGYY